MIPKRDSVYWEAILAMSNAAAAVAVAMRANAAPPVTKMAATDATISIAIGNIS